MMPTLSFHSSLADRTECRTLPNFFKPRRLNAGVTEVADDFVVVIHGRAE